MVQTRQRKIFKAVALTVSAVACAVGFYLATFGAYCWYSGRMAIVGTYADPRVVEIADVAFDPLFDFQDADYPGSRMLAFWSEWCAWKGLGSPNLKLEQATD